MAEYILQRNATMLYDTLIHEAMLDVLIDTIQIYYSQTPSVSVPIVLSLVHSRSRLFNPRKYVSIV